MNTEIVGAIEDVIHGIWEYLLLIFPDQDPRTILEKMRAPFKNSSSAAAYQRVAMDATLCRDDVAALHPAEIYELLGLLIDKDKRRELLSGKSNKEGKVIKSKLAMIRDQQLAPVVLLKTGKLPGIRRGRPTQMPGDEVCREICLFIVEQTAKKKVPALRAQEQATNKWNLSMRMVQRIWQRRDALLDDSDETDMD